MMVRLLGRLLLLVLVSSRGVATAKASNDALSCGYDVNCQAIQKVASTVTEINEKLGVSTRFPEVSEKLDKISTNVNEISSKQKTYLELVNVNGSLASSAAILTQLGKHSADLLRHDERLKVHDLLLNNVYQLVKSIYGAEFGPRDCTDIRAMGHTASGIYRVYFGNYIRRMDTDVYCDFRYSTDSWLVFQRRRDGSQNFDRTWKEYQNGFGSLSGEFWLGNEKLSLLTTNQRFKLRIELEDFTGQSRWAEYSTFSVRPSPEKYRLAVSGYSGNAGDSFTYHNNMMFSTKDADNDGYSSLHCAQSYTGAWWFNSCHHSGLNGRYLNSAYQVATGGIYWAHWKGSYYSLKATEMKIAAVK